MQGKGCLHTRLAYAGKHDNHSCYLETTAGKSGGIPDVGAGDIANLIPEVEGVRRSWQLSCQGRQGKLPKGGRVALQIKTRPFSSVFGSIISAQVTSYQ